MDSILTFDPGESTGWAYRNSEGKVTGGTLPKDHREVAGLIRDLMPDVVVYETFRMYPGKAQALAWNSFYPCEVIGVIKVTCMEEAIPMVEQAPSVKPYAGGLGPRWEELKKVVKVTEHVKDALLHLNYYERYNEKKK